MTAERTPSDAGKTSLTELAWLFLRLGSTAFGGPAAHIALMRDEVVRRRRWMTEERFLDLLGATNLIPGPNSTELAIHVGYDRRRWAGLIVAGVSFIMPAMLITGLLGGLYVRFGKLPQTAWLLWGVKPVILAIVVQALWMLVPAAARTWSLRALGIAAVVASAAGLNELGILLGAGAVAAVLHARRGASRRPLAQVVPGAALVAASATASAVSLPGLFGVFLKIGSVLFGSGYVLLAFLRADLVHRLHWLTEGQLIDAVAAGQVTPGPVFTTATFVGYLLAGAPGALVATAGIFLPAFVFVALSGPLVPKLRASPAAGAFLDGVNVASLALMAVVTAQLARATIVDPWTVAIGVAASVLLVRFRLNSTWLIGGGALVGLAAHLAGVGR
ncbi:MAG TPA: chromate efflux transporter [Polyangia bacterium]|nr:chromate efflux transporter [Polyangia bacterium]